ncbi:MAG: aminotransferase class V-fold PLP-dependent enzyme [Acidilobaceae archaeon]
MPKLLTPGPVEVPRPVLEAMLRAPKYHRDREFREFFSRLREKLLKLSRGAAEVAVLAGSGTTAVDASVWSLIERGERVLALVWGEFGERMLDSAIRRGAIVDVMRAPAGSVVDESSVLEKLESGLYSSLILVHNESSTGVVYSQLETLARRSRDLGVKVIVDSVSGFAGARIENSWGITAIATSSQKALAAPPGVGLVFLSEEGVGEVEKKGRSAPPMLDLSMYVEYSRRVSETPFTPALPILSALDAAVDLVLSAGLERYIEEHYRRAGFLYERLAEAGLEPLPESPSIRSPTITAFKTPIDSKIVVESVLKRGYKIAQGMREFKDKIVRIGVMGDVTLSDLEVVASTIAEVVAGRGLRGSE